MKIKVTHRFNAPLEKVQEAREKRFENLDKFPEMKQYREFWREQKGNVLKTKRRIELSAHIPPALRGVLKPEMLRCVDDSEYDFDSGVHVWTVIPEHHRDVFFCKGKSVYRERIKQDGTPETVRDLEMVIKVKVPVVGKIAEQVLGKAYEKNLEKDCQTIKKMLGIMENDGKPSTSNGDEESLDEE
ncbi:MAG: DUF2505 family protein [bacterium]